MTDVQYLNLLRADCQLESQHRHCVVRQIDLLQPVGNPRIVREGFLGDEGDLVVTQIDSLQGQAIVQETVGLVVQAFQLISRQIESPQGHEALERSIRNVSEIIVRQVQREQLQQPFESSTAHVSYLIVS